MDEAPEGDENASVLEAIVRRVEDLKAFKYRVVGRALGTIREHCEQEKNCLDSLGAAFFKAGKVLSIEAMSLAYKSLEM